MVRKAVSQQTFGSSQDDACSSIALSLCHRGARGTIAYTESKLCDVLLAFALARRIRLIRSIRRDADADAEMSFCLIDRS